MNITIIWKFQVITLHYIAISALFGFVQTTLKKEDKL